MSSKIEDKLDEIKHLIYNKGEYKKALEVIKTVENMKGVSEEDSLMCSIYKCQAITKQGDFNKSIKFCEELIKKAEVLNNDVLTLAALVEKMEALWRLGDYHLQMESVIKAEMIIEKLPNEKNKYIQEKIGYVFLWKATYYWLMPNYEQAFPNIQLGLKCFEMINEKFHIALSKELLSTLYMENRNFDLAISYKEQSLKIFEEIGHKRQIALTLTNLGGIYISQGYYKKGLSFCERSLELRKSIGNKQDIAITLNQIAQIKLILGEYKQALDICKLALAYSEEIEDRKYIPNYIKQIGKIYSHLGNDELALEYLQNSLKLAVQMESHFIVASILFDLIIKYLEIGDEQQAKKHFNHLHTINSQVDYQEIDNLYYLSKAYLLKTSDESRSRGKAEGILEYLVTSRKINFSHRIDALLNLCELLLVEFTNTGKNEIFEDLTKKIDYLIDIARSHQTAVLLIEGYRLKSLVYLIRLDIPKSKRTLEEALTMAKEKELDKLVTDIQNDLNQITEKKPLWDKLKKEKRSLVEILKQTPLMNGMKRLAKETILAIEESGTTDSFEQRKLFTLKI